MTIPVLSVRALNRALLARQMLLERSAISVHRAIEHLVGMQAQLPTPPYYGLWSRLANFNPQELSQLFLDRQVARIALMRSTVHLVTADDALALRPVMQSAVARGLTPGSPFGKALATVDLAELAVLARELVEARPLTGNEVGVALQDRWPGVDVTALSIAARAALPLVQVPPRGTWGGIGQSRSTTAESWIGRPLAEPDVAQVIRRYLAAYGPASVRDIQAWSGLTGLGRIITELEPELLTFQDEAGVLLFDIPNAPRPSVDLSVPVRFLPDFDQILLAHADRSRIFRPELKNLIFSNNGIIRAFVLIDGFARALWKIESTKDTATLVVRPLPPDGREVIRPREWGAVEKEGRALLRFAVRGKSHDIRFEAGSTRATR
ncbi:hypothetical protein ABIB25_001701 [Nakamurella sp. UYEF19]|uniref:winged helix DNA-binding domain-containing protein n=1 Tax=Nakamurella sp. UYEF19 TaxID=1756392 RepID=UPI003398F48A